MVVAWHLSPPIRPHQCNNLTLLHCLSARRPAMITTENAWIMVMPPHRRVNKVGECKHLYRECTTRMEEKTQVDLESRAPCSRTTLGQIHTHWSPPVAHLRRYWSSPPDQRATRRCCRLLHRRIRSRSGSTW
jgi:hypothetical protein